MLIQWDSSLATGDPEIDRQHQQLFAIASDLHTACLDERPQDSIDGILTRLTSYTREHFQAEQALMARCGYPPADVADHVAQHVLLTRQVDELVGQHARGELVTVMPVALFLHDWLRTHIRQVDQKLVEFIHAT